MCDIVQITEIAIKSFLSTKSISTKDKCWEIKNSSLGGRGIFSTRDIQPGEVIFIDCPIIIGPRAGSDIKESCVICFKLEDLFLCENKCGLPVCSRKCQNSELHKKECNLINSWKHGVSLDESRKILKCLTPLRSLFLNEEEKKLVSLLKSHSDPKHGALIDILKIKLKISIPHDDENFLRMVCSVLDVNAFEVLVGCSQNQFAVRGLYPLGSLVNHNCSPNTNRVFDEHQRMIVRAAVFIPKSTEICNSYARITWGTLTRRFHLLNTKHFACKCQRCCDPSEFGTNLNALKCDLCKEIVLPEDPLKLKTKWICVGCKKVMPGGRVGVVNSILGSQVEMINRVQDVGLILMLLDRLEKIVPNTNQMVVELKYKLVWILGYKEKYLMNDLPAELIDRKEEICKEILDLLAKLKTGRCKMRGLLLYELYRCLGEKNRRKERENNMEINNNVSSGVLDEILTEAADILLYDTGAPEEIKQIWKTVS